MEDLEHLVTFARVAKAGSFAAAARQLKITGSVASKHVAKLEKSLGVRLLNRSTRKLSLTEAGTVYYEHCTRIVEELERSRDTLAKLQDAPRGLLRVTAPVPIASTLGPMLREFLGRYPDIQIELDASNRVVDLADEGFDLAIRVARSLPPNVVARPLVSMRLHLYASPQYLEREGTPQNPSDLTRHNCLTVPLAMPDSVWRFVRGSERAEVPVQGSLQSNTVEALRDLVLGGAGVTLMPGSMVVREEREARLKPLLNDWEIDPRINIYAIFLPTRFVPPKLRVFVDFLAERFTAFGDPPP